MDKEFYDKYSKDLECSCCQDLQHCINAKEPLKINCAIHYFKDKIAYLEAKLAKSEKLTERLQQIVDKLRDKEFAGKSLVEAVNAVYEPLYQNKYDEAERLKQQLAEKDEEIEDYKKMHWNMQYQHLNELNELANQTAIAELEKVKEWLNIPFDENGCLKNGEDLENYIDQQIKELKGE